MKNKLSLIIMSVLTFSILLMPAAFASSPPDGYTVDTYLGNQSFNSDQNKIYTDFVKIENGTDVGFYQYFGCSISTAQYKAILERNAMLFLWSNPVVETDYRSFDLGWGRVWRNVNNATLKSFRYSLLAQNNKNSAGNLQSVTGDMHILAGWFGIAEGTEYVDFRKPR